MLKSMTAFGRCRKTVEGKDITAEIKSVNNRYFDCSVKISRMYSFLEEKIKAYLQEKGIARGKIDVYVGIDVLEQAGVQIDLDPAYTAAYVAALRRLRDEFGLTDDISVMSVASNRDVFVFTKPEDDIEKDWDAVRSVLDEAIDAFLAGRAKEGANLERDLTAKVENIRRMAEEVRRLSAEDLEQYPSKLETRIKQFLADQSVAIDEQRILTEVAIFADRVAIDEELVRLESHFGAFYGILEANEPAGRKLDFLLQEMNRETNTIGSKANNTRIAHTVVNIKTELEKIREQIQNIE